MLRRGGRVALSTWAADNPFQIWCHEVLRPFVPAPAPNGSALKDDLKFDTPSQIETALQQAGFKGLQISVEENDFVYASEEQYWLSLWSAGIRRQLEKMTPALLDQAKSEVFRKLQAVKKPDGFHKANCALIALGTKTVQS